MAPEPAPGRLRPDRRRGLPPTGAASSGCAPTWPGPPELDDAALDDLTHEGPLLPVLLVRVVPGCRRGRSRTWSAHRTVGEQRLRDPRAAPGWSWRCRTWATGLGRDLGCAPGCRCSPWRGNKTRRLSTSSSPTGARSAWRSCPSPAMNLGAARSGFGPWARGAAPRPRPGSRTWIEVLCGERARMLRGPAVLARRTGAALLPRRWPTPARTWRSPSTRPSESRETRSPRYGCHRTVHEEFRAHPTDWHMMQRCSSPTSAPATAGVVDADRPRVPLLARHHRKCGATKDLAGLTGLKLTCPCSRRPRRTSRAADAFVPRRPRGPVNYNGWSLV